MGDDQSNTQLYPSSVQLPGVRLLTCANTTNNQPADYLLSSPNNMIAVKLILIWGKEKLWLEE